MFIKFDDKGGIGINLEKLSIGQMARINHVSIQALRLYDKKGLLKPMLVDELTGYRYYHINQSARLDMILHMKAYGMTLNEIKKQLDSHDLGEIKNFLKKRSKSIDKEILELERKKKTINRIIKNYEIYENLPKDSIIFTEYIEDRYIYKYTSEYNFFSGNGAGYEYMLRELKQNLLDKEFPIIYFFNAGTIMRKENIMSNKFIANEVFIFVDSDYKELDNVEKIPGGLYLAKCSNDFNKEYENAKYLIEEIEQRGFSINGDYICEVIAEFPIFEDEHRNIFYKIQIPIK